VEVQAHRAINDDSFLGVFAHLGIQRYDKHLSLRLWCPTSKPIFDLPSAVSTSTRSVTRFQATAISTTRWLMSPKASKLFARSASWEYGKKGFRARAAKDQFRRRQNVRCRSKPEAPCGATDRWCRLTGMVGTVALVTPPVRIGQCLLAVFLFVETAVQPLALFERRIASFAKLVAQPDSDDLVCEVRSHRAACSDVNWKLSARAR
jgi:hypothetical protein